MEVIFPRLPANGPAETRASRCRLAERICPLRHVKCRREVSSILIAEGFSLVSRCGGQKSRCSGWEAGVRVCCRTSLIFSCLRRFPILWLNPSRYLPAAEGRSASSSPVPPAAGLSAAAPECCRVGCPSAWPGECEGSVFRKIFQATRQAFKMLAACCSVGFPTVSVRVCDPCCRITLRQSAPGAGLCFALFFFFCKGKNVKRLLKSQLEALRRKIKDVQPNT